MTRIRPAGELVDTRSMVCVHTFLRREFRLAAGAIRVVDAGDVRRARTVADHLGFLVTFLHHHHSGEDRLLWPKLLERVPEDLAPIVQLMQGQHERVDALLQDIEPVRTRWRARAGEADRDELARMCDELYVALTEHLDAEEERVLPIVARAITPAEWHELGEAGVRSLRRADLPLALGMVQYEGDPDVVAEILGDAPRLVRLIVPALSRRAFRKHARAVYGTPTP